ncbi:MAG: hypothetical protein ACKKMW_00005 [Candidatus Nealsonbacteria bacterium]
MDKKQNKKEYITLQEATKYCDYSQEYLSLRARQGKLMAVKFKRNWLIKKEWLKEYLKQPSNYISLKQAAEYCDYSHDYLSLRARQGKLKAVKLANNWMTKKKWLDRYLKKHQKKVKQKVIKTEVVKILPPPDNLPVEEFQPGVKVFRSISITRMLRTGVVSVLIAGLLISGALAGKGFFSNTLMPHLAQTHRVIGKFLNRSVLPIIEDYPILRNVLFSLAAAGESVGDILRAYFSWLGNSFKSISQTITKAYFAFHNFLNENTKQGFEAIKNSAFSFFDAVGKFFADISQGKRISLFSKEKLLTEEIFIETEERLTEKLIEAFQQIFEKLTREGIPSKQIITEIQPIKEITKEVRTIDSAALIQLRADIEYVQAELVNRLYAPGGVITQQIYITEPIQSPKIYQENGEIVLQTIGQGNIIISAATGLQLHGEQVIIDSTSILNPLIYLADATRIDGSLTANGPITAQRITLNAPADFIGKILDVQSAGASKFSVDNDGTALLVGDFTITGDLSISGNQALDGTFTISASSSSSILTVTQTGNGKIFNFTSTADSTQNLGTITGITTNAILALYQQGTGSVLIATTTSSTTQPAIKITNLGTGDSFVIESQDTDSSPFVIDSSGNVGISTSSPLYTLQIWGNTFIGTSTTPTLFVDTGTQRIGIGTSTPAQALHIIGNILGSGNAVFEGVLDVQGYTTSTFAGPVQITTTTQPQLVIAYSSTTYSTFSVSSNGSTALVSTNSFNLTGAGSSIWQTTNYGSLTIQSASSTEIISGDTLTASSTNEILFVTAGLERMRILTSGYVGIATSTPSYPLHVWGSAGFGTSTIPTLYIDSGNGRVGIATSTPNEALTVAGNIFGTGNITISGDIMPNNPRTQDIGSAAYDWENIYVYSVYANNIYAASSTIAGTTAETFTINSDAAADATSSLRFYRGVDTPHALLTWDAGYDRFNFNFPLYLSGTGNITASGALTIQSADTLTATSTNEMILAVAGQERVRILTSGYVGIATSTPSAQLAVTGNVMIDGDLKFIGDQTIEGSGTLTINPAGNLYFQSASNYIDESGNLVLAGNLTSPKTISPILEYSGNITINATSSGATTVTVINEDGRAVADLVVEGDIQIDGGKLTLASGETIDAETTDNLKINSDDLTIIYSSTNEIFRVSADGIKVSGQATTTDTLYVTSGGADITGNVVLSGTIDTGQGVTEVYLMDQDVRTSDNVTFSNLIITNITTTTDLIVQTSSQLGTVSSGIWQGTEIGADYGGTGFTSYSIGDLIYASGSATLAQRNIGSSGQVLIVSGGIPVWGQVTSSAIAADSLDWSEFTDSMTLDSTTTIAMNNVSLDFKSGTLYIDGVTGNVGVGTTAPGAKLEIDGVENTFQVVASPDLSVNAFGGFGIRGWDAGSGSIKSAFVKERTLSYGVGKIHILNNVVTDDTNADLTDSVLTIDTLGNVGIGTTVPSDKLTVVGGNIAIGDGSATTTISTSIISSTGVMDLKTSGDTNDYLQFYTSGDIPRIKVIGGSDLYFESDGGHINFQAPMKLGEVIRHSVGSLNAVATQAKRFEVARIGYDQSNWSYNSPVFVELYERYSYGSGYKKYVARAGYIDDGSYRLLETTGELESLDEVRLQIGAPVLVSGTIYYLPIYVDVDNYMRWYCIITHNTASEVDAITDSGQIRIFESPSGSNIASFTETDVVYHDYTNYFSGNVGIGTTTPSTLLSVGTTLGSQFLVDSSGIISDGVWQGTAIGDSFLTKTGDWTGTFDGQEGSYYQNADNLNAGIVPSARLSQTQAFYITDPRLPATNQVHSTLSTPTIAELSIPSSPYIGNKLIFTIPTIHEYTANGTDWYSTSYTDTQLKKLVQGRYDGSSVYIPSPNDGEWVALRFTFTSPDYRYLNWLYLYTSTGGHQLNVKIEKSYGAETDNWIQVAQTNNWSGWSAHQSIPHSNIPWRSTPTPGTHSKYVRITFYPTYNGSYPANRINLYNINWYGYYPANPQSDTWYWDENNNFYIKENLNVVGNATFNDLTLTYGLSVATSTFSGMITANGGITGTLTGNADTATALAANGANCSAGEYPLGVDASGAVENCTDATTEITSAISTHAGDDDAHHALVTLAGTPNYLTLSGQEITMTVLDIGDDTNLTAGTNITLSDDTLNVDDAFLLNTGDTGTGNYTLDGNFYIDTNEGSNAAYITRLGAADQGLKVYASDKDLYTRYIEDTGETSPGTWHFINERIGGSSYEFMTVQPDGDVIFDGGGNVGIASTTPSFTLSVNGDVGWTGTLQQGSVPWARLASFPSDCSAGDYIYGVGGTLKCSTPAAGGGSNWEFVTVNAITPTSTVGIILNASSTINHNLTVGTSTALYVDSGNGRVGIGTTGPDRKLDILDSTNPQLRITQADGSTYADFKVDSAGDLTIDAQGGDIRALDENLWVCAGGACPSFGFTGNGNLGVESDIELTGHMTMGPHMNSTERSTDYNYMVKLKETRIGFGGSGLKVIIQIKIRNKAGGMTVALYINGVSVADIFSGTLAASDTYYEFEISPSVGFEANDDIQIWGRAWTTGGNYTLFVRNFQVWGTMDFVNKL